MLHRGKSEGDWTACHCHNRKTIQRAWQGVDSLYLHSECTPKEIPKKLQNF